ncbi:MAG: DUF6531 domain-containing protein [Acidobacteria bacterium]|nr:DUF6531 domain-containing protein [Acidobacteriota bacterium]
MHLERFYASQMNSNGFVGSLGTNWMHNFEQRLKVTASTAVVTLFPGRQIAFTGAGSVWAVAPTEKTNYQLQSTGGGFQFADPEELRIYTFTAGGQLTRIEDRNGNAITVTQSSAGPASVSDGLGRTITFTYDASGHLTSAKDQAGRTVQYFYTGLDLTLVSNVLGPFTRFQYATGGPPSLLSAKTYPVGNVPNRQQYDSSGKVVSQTADGGNTTTFTYAPGNATTVTDPLGSKFTQSHSDRGAMTSSVDHSGQATSMTYDSANHRTSTTNRLGATASVAYDPAGGAPALFTDPLGNVTAYTFITQAQNGFSYRLASQVTYADGSVRSLAYDARGNVLSITDPDGNKTQFAYDSHGWLTSATNPLGGVTTLVNNADGTLASAALPSGDTEKYAYDDRKRLVKTTRADGAQRSYTYNDLDQLLTTTNEAGDTQNSRFSLNNSLTAQSDYAGTYMTMFRDTQNRLAAITDPGGNNTLLAYDAAGRLKSSTSPSGFQMLRNYDAMGRTTSISDAAGPITSSVYDKEGRITTAVDGAGRAVNFTYDAAGNVTQVSNDAYSAVMDFDQLNRVTRVADGAGIATGYSYTRGGHVSAVNLGAIGVSLTYDAQGNVVTASDPNGKQWTLGRDSMGRMVSRKDPLGNTRTFEYDSRQRLSRINLPDGTVSFSFDGTGRLLSQTYSDDTQLKFTYAKNGLLLTANGAAFAYDSQHRLTNSNGITIARDVDGRIVSMTYGDGLTVTYSYNNRGMVSRVADSKGGGADLSYDAGNQLVTISRSNGVVTTLGVDSAGRTINIADGSLAAIKVTRDTAGKVIASDRSLPGTPAPAEGTVSLSYDDASQLTAGKYDGEGRLTSDGQRSYTWDLASRLVSYNGAGASTSFTYDANGMMLSSSGSGGTRQYVSNYVFGLPVIAIVRDGDNQDLRYYVPLPGGTPLYSIEAGDGSRRFFHYDEAGNTTFLTDDAGAVTDSYGITPYGESVTHTGPSDNPFTFQGAVGAMQVDSAGLYYMRARFYDGGSGRFLSRDPITRNTSPLSINPYQYAEGNPLAKGDPSGADALSQHALQQGKFFQWSAFEGAMSQYYIGQQVVLQVIKDAFADANASNASRLCFFSWCNRSYQDPAGLAASRLRSLLGSGYQLDVEGIYSPLPYINSVYHAASSGDLNGLARAYKSLFGTAATTMIGQDAEALIRQANGLNVRFGPLAGSNGINLGRDAAHWINHAMTGLVSHDGGSVISNDGGTVISNDGGTFTNLLMGLISQDGSGLISQDGGGLISQDGGGLISQDGGGVIGEHSSGFSFRIGR